MSENSMGKPQKIDIVSFLDVLLNRFTKFWWVMVLVTLLFGAFFYFRSSVSYTPSYTADATVTVEIVNGSSNYSNESTAELINNIFPYLMSTNILSDMVKADLGLSYVPATVRASNIKGTNLLTITASGSNAERVYATLQSVLQNLPRAARYVVGQTQLSMIDNSGFPVDAGRTSVVRGSIRKGLLIGAAISLVMLVLYTIFTRTVRSEKELKNLVNVHALGTIPVYRQKRGKEGNESSVNLLYMEGHNNYEEAVRMVRTRIDHLIGEDKVMMVTSSLPGEGKSTVAANLAVSMARKGKRVILVDCDLRNPSQQAIFRLEGSYPGLEGVLRGTDELTDTMVRVTSDDGRTSLVLIPGRPRGAKSSEILGSEKMADVLEELKEQADIVILDTPPSAVLMDAMFVAGLADDVVYVVLSDYAKRRVITRGLEELQQNGANIMGCVLNGGRVRFGTSYSNRYGSYGSYQAKEKKES